MAHANSPGDSFSLTNIGRKSRVVKSGVVYYKSSKTSLQNLRKYRCELYRESTYHPRQLELTDPHKCAEEISETITLENVFKVLMNEGMIKGKFVFHIMTSKGKFTFGTESSEETDNWVDVLNKELFGPPKHDITYEYRVKVIKNDEGNVAYGDYLLKVYNEEIRLFTSNGLIPTKFRCPIKEIHKVKHHAVGPQKCCVIVSVKNIQTNNKAKDILMLNTESAADVAKVINYRKKNLASQDDLDITMQSRKELATEKLQESNSKDVKIAKAICLSNPLLKRQKHVPIFRPRSEFDVAMMTRTASDGSGSFSGNKGSRSLPGMYHMTKNPSLEENSVLGESFDLRAPKRKEGIKIRQNQSQTDLHDTINDRPPATLPCSTETDHHDDSNAYAIIGSAPKILSDSKDYSTTKLSNSTYYCVKQEPKKLPRPYSTSSVTLNAGISEYSDGIGEEYVIRSVNHDQTQAQYLHVLSSEEESIYIFMPDRRTS